MQAEGGAAFVRACGRNEDHVNRVVRRYLECTTTELVNAARMSAAANRLRTSGNDVLSIALESGFSNLSYFYRAVFRAAYGLTPGRYREREHRVVLVTPEPAKERRENRQG